MNRKLLYFFLTLAFLRCQASMVQDVSDQDELCAQFMEAAANGSTDLIKELLAKGVDVNVRDDDDYLALSLAAFNGHLDCVTTLLEAKADSNAKTKGALTALHCAAVGGHIDCLRALIVAKANVNDRTATGNTALLLAAREGHVDCVRALIQAKANVNACGDGGQTALTFLGDLGNDDGVKMLLEAKADLKTALRNAALNDHIECVKFLIPYSYCLVPTERVVSNSRQRIFNVLLQFVWLRNQHPTLAHLQNLTLQFEILSKNDRLQKDLAIILLDELKKGKKIKPGALSKSKEAAANYILQQIGENFSQVRWIALTDDMRALLDQAEIEENFGPLVREGLNERIKVLKDRGSV